MSSPTIPAEFSRVCVSDLDGTLLPHKGEISPANLEMLRLLGQRAVCRVLATGRSLYSLQKAIPEDSPFDYVIFATGAGIMDWHTKQLLHAQNLDGEQIRLAAGVLEEYQVDFMVHGGIPDTHFMHYRSHSGIADFLQRIELYRDYACELDLDTLPAWESATQLLGIVESGKDRLYQAICRRLEPLTAIRTTSPLDFDSLWIEIFAPGVNKGEGLLRLLTHLGLDLAQTMVIGNDFNDLDMLRLCPVSYVTDNAPPELKAQFKTVPACEEDGFSRAVELWLQSADSRNNH